MTLKQWAANGWLRDHRSSAEEIGNLLAIVERDLKDAAEGIISADWRFGIAYNAALKLCTILLYAEGYKAERTLHHYRTIQAFPFILGSERKKIRIIWMPVDPKGILSNMIMSGVLQKTMRTSS